MPKVACPPDKVYDKSKKKCVEIGGENYKNTLSKNPDAFKAYDKKIAKFFTNSKTCKNGEAYYAPTKRCLKVGGQTYKMYMKKNPGGFVTVKKAPTPVKKTPTPVKKVCKDGEAYYAPTKRCLKVGGQTYKMYMKKNPNGFNTKPLVKNKLLLTPIIEKKIISEKTKKLFMFKVSKFLRAIKNTKHEEVLAGMAKSKTAPPKHILIIKDREVHIPFTVYFPYDSSEIKASSFNKRSTKPYRSEVLKISNNNFFEKVQKYALKSYTNPNIIDLKWFKETMAYYKKLQPLELYTIWAYTHKGDVYLNLWERGLKIDYNRIEMSVFLYEIIEYLANPNNSRDIFTMEKVLNTNYLAYKSMQPIQISKLFHKLLNESSRYFRPSFIETLIANMSSRLSGIIRNSPATKETMVVYRGVRDSFFTADDFEKRPKVNEVFVNKGFISTSLDPNVAHAFSTETCCFKVITVLPGSKCLPLYGVTQYVEHELLFNKDTKYIIRDKYIAHVPKNRVYSYSGSVTVHKVKMSDIVIG